jgi:hypothetical protein
MEKHLHDCTPDQEWKKQQKELRDKGFPKPKKQVKLSFEGHASKAGRLDHLFGMAIFTSCASFNMFEPPEWEAFFKALG